MRTLLLACAALSLACSDNGPDTPDPMAEVRGSWTSESWEFRGVDNPAQKLDLIDAGFTGTLDVQPSGAFTISLNFQGDESVQTGTLSVRGDKLVFSTEDGEVLLKYTSAGGTMIWDTTVPEEGDIDADGVEDSFTEHVVFRRS